MSAPSPIWIGSAGLTGLAFQPESGRISCADRVTLTDVYKGTYEACVGGLLRRGVLGTGLRDGWVVTSSVVERERGNIGKLVINWELSSAAGGSLPIAEFDSQPLELYPKIERAPYFAGITEETLGLAYGSVLGASQQQRADNWSRLNGLSDPQLTLGLKLVAKLRSGEESFYVAGMRFMYTYYSFGIPTLSLGGFIETPGFAVTAGLDGKSWLRLADHARQSGVSGSVVAVTQTWLGGPVGYWDPDSYS